MGLTLAAPRAETRDVKDDDHRRRDALLIGLAVLAGLVLRVIVSLGDDVIVSNDEATYLASGINLWNGNGFTALSGGAELHYPPGLPFVLGGVHQIIGGDPHTATLVVNVVTTTLVILPIAGIASLIAGRRAAVVAAWFAALCPATVLLNAGGSAGLFTLLAITALWLGLRCTSWSTRGAVLGAAGAGLLVGGAYLTRPEGLFFAAVLVPVLALAALGGWRNLRRAEAAAWRRAGLLVADFVVPLGLLAAPYVAYLHRETGAWQLTAKSQAMSAEAWLELAQGDRSRSLAEQYRLDETGYRFQPSRAVSSIVLDEPGTFFSIVWANIEQLAITVFEPLTTPYWNWVLIPPLLLLLAAFAVWRYRHDRAVLATVAAIAVPILTAVTYFVIDRYLVVAGALLCALVAVGALALPKGWRTAAVVVTIALLASSTATALYSPAEGWFHPNARNPEKRILGEWIRDHSDRDDLVMASNAVVGHYANRDIVPVPYASPAKVVEFARHYGVRYLVIDRGNTVRFRPQLAPLVTRAPGRGVRTVFGGGDRLPGVVVLELVPRPPKFDGEPPLLDQPPKET
jgi:Dolichyl-phosphate-mannose-protein mannosyltransferase